MIAVIILGVLAVFFAWLESVGILRHGLKISFLFIFIFLAIRYYFGNDYESYVDMFERISYNSTPDFTIQQGDAIIEPGWILLNFLFKYIGFFGVIIFTSFVFCVSYYKFFKRYVPQDYYWFSLIMFIFIPTFFLIQLSAIRQSIAILIVLLSFKYIFEKKLLLFVLSILLASFFHISVFFVLPLYILGIWDFKIKKIAVVFFTFLFLWIIFNINSILPESSNLISLYFSKYEMYYKIEDANFGSGLGLLYQSIMFFLTMYYMNLYQNEDSLMFKLAIVYFMLVPIGIPIVLVERVNYYFQPALLVAFPLIISSIKISPLKFILKLFIITYAVNSFVKFMYNDIWIDAFYTYKTIFSAPSWE